MHNCNNEPLCLFHCFNRHFTGLIMFLRLLSCHVLIYSYDCNLQYFESEPYLHAYIFLSKQFYTDTCICTYVSLLKFMFSPNTLLKKSWVICIFGKCKAAYIHKMNPSVSTQHPIFIFKNTIPPQDLFFKTIFFLVLIHVINRSGNFSRIVNILTME